MLGREVSKQKPKPKRYKKKQEKREILREYENGECCAVSESKMAYNSGLLSCSSIILLHHLYLSSRFGFVSSIHSNPNPPNLLAMQSQQQETDELEVNKRLLQELEDMGFTIGRAARALHHSGNASLEAAINWIIDHENDPDIDQVPLIAVNIDIESPQPLTTEEIQNKVQELRDQVRKRNEEEEKKLEREKEKERIRAGKEILAAKRIAEENERKRYLALRKAEKEEEKRAREKVLQKLEADKVERRRMLGLPPSVSHEAINTSRHVVQEKKNFYLSATRAEQLRECLRSLRRNHKDDDATVKRAFQTLLIYVGNVAKNPDVEKFRKIRITNPLFQERVGRLKGGIEFLELCGFERIEGSNFLYLPYNKVDMALLNSAGTEIRSAITNPFYGLLSYG
ncbi:E3 ubiquitin-protein ligase BRE1A [Manihot esculenta]|uniref:UBA domain-containing protein n=1 Tax=Manihot esculenta TaxID=3983 RepID=A0A2C9UTR4_MANES|nr:E3 ubiquitin-protein ligase BRE1A [Manihot esculenta]OAY34774.1 hypothetical protein MANES_12G046400v8 [Manihot esculenta]